VQGFYGCSRQPACGQEVTFVVQDDSSDGLDGLQIAFDEIV
jgi:hypothetical protein